MKNWTSPRLKVWKTPGVLGVPITGFGKSSFHARSEFSLPLAVPSELFGPKSWSSHTAYVGMFARTLANCGTARYSRCFAQIFL